VKGAAALLRRETVSKETNGAANGFLKHYFSCGTTAYAAALRWEIVLVDNDNSDTSTRSQQREYVLLEWDASIRPAPRTGP